MEVDVWRILKFCCGVLVLNWLYNGDGLYVLVLLYIEVVDGVYFLGFLLFVELWWGDLWVKEVVSDFEWWGWIELEDVDGGILCLFECCKSFGRLSMICVMFFIFWLFVCLVLWRSIVSVLCFFCIFIEFLFIIVFKLICFVRLKVVCKIVFMFFDVLIVEFRGLRILVFKLFWVSLFFNDWYVLNNNLLCLFEFVMWWFKFKLVFDFLFRFV